MSVHSLSWGTIPPFTCRNHGISLQPTMAANLGHIFKPWATWTWLSSADDPDAMISTVNDANFIVPRSTNWQFWHTPGVATTTLTHRLWHESINKIYLVAKKDHKRPKECHVLMTKYDINTIWMSTSNNVKSWFSCSDRTPSHARRWC